VPVTKTPPPHSDECYDPVQHKKHTLFSGTRAIQTRFYGNKKVWNIIYTHVEVLYTFKFQYSTCRKLMFSVFIPILHAYTEFCVAFLSTEYCTKSKAHDMVIKYEICYFKKYQGIT